MTLTRTWSYFASEELTPQKLNAIIQLFISDIDRHSGANIYGHTPVMITENNVSVHEHEFKQNGKIKTFKISIEDISWD